MTLLKDQVFFTQDFETSVKPARPVLGLIVERELLRFSNWWSMTTNTAAAPKNPLRLLFQ